MAHAYLGWLAERLRVTEETAERLFEAKSVDHAIAKSEAFIGSLSAQGSDVIRRRDD